MRPCRPAFSSLARKRSKCSRYPPPACRSRAATAGNGDVCLLGPMRANKGAEHGSFGAILLEVDYAVGVDRECDHGRYFCGLTNRASAAGDQPRGSEFYVPLIAIGDPHRAERGLEAPVSCKRWLDGGRVVTESPMLTGATPRTHRLPSIPPRPAAPVLAGTSENGAGQSGRSSARPRLGPRRSKRWRFPPPAAAPRR